MQTSTQTIRNINAARASTNESPRYQGQYKGDAWYVYDARTNAWGLVPYETAALAEAAAQSLNVLYQDE